MKASLKNYRQAPRKMRLVADQIRGQRVLEARQRLANFNKKASWPLGKLLASAVASAKEAGLEEKNLVVKKVTVDKGVTLRRSQPAARGRATRINKETSHVAIILAEAKKN